MNARPLQSLLLEADQAGAFHLLDRDLAELQAAAGALGLFNATLDLTGCTDQRELMARMASALRLPDYFGHNWDALDECLADLEWLDAEGFVLAIEHSRELRTAGAGDYATLVSVLENASDQWRGHGVPFWAFITLPEAEFDAL